MNAQLNAIFHVAIIFISAWIGSLITNSNFAFTLLVLIILNVMWCVLSIYHKLKYVGKKK